MKARVKATGEIVEVMRRIVQGRDYLEYVWYYRAEDKYFKEYELEFNINNLDKDEPDYWTKLKHQAAIAAMQGICANYNDFTKDNDGSVSNTEIICENAKIIATVLVNKLKNEN